MMVNAVRLHLRDTAAASAIKYWSLKLRVSLVLGYWYLELSDSPVVLLLAPALCSSHSYGPVVPWFRSLVVPLTASTVRRRVSP